MSIRRAALSAVFFIVVSLLFADSYSIRVVNADEMSVTENTVTLEGNVVIAFSTTSGEEGSTEDTTEDNGEDAGPEANVKERNLSADRIVFMMDDKVLQATGNVLLTEGKDNSFEGQALMLDWDSLDIVVFYGNSASDRKSAKGDTVHFYSTGRTISYDGTENVVFFSDGVIATKETDPYWSVQAKRIAILQSDMFFENATIRIGRVPVLWLPVFFYTGTRLAFNPAIGISSSRGMFINTTTELYGVNPSIGVTSASSKKTTESDAGSVAASALSFLRSTESGETIREGLIYRELADKSSLSGLERWARDTGSYFSITADAYEYNGIALGYDTKNILFDKSLTLQSKGVAAFRNIPLDTRYGKIRYAFDFSGSYKTDKSNLSFSIPVNSDPSVRYSFFNRNTVFGIDSVFGATQSFPSTYNDTSTHVWSLEGSTTLSSDNYKFRVESLRSQVNWKWNSTTGKYTVTSAQLPYVKISSSGTFFNIEGDSTKREVEKDYSNSVARDFARELKELSSGSGTFTAPDGLVLYAGPQVKTTETVTDAGGYIKSGYTYNQTFRNLYKEDMEKDDMSTSLSGSVNIEGALPSNIFTFSESIVPDYSYLRDEYNAVTASSKIQSKLSASLPTLGLTYNLNINLFTYSDKNGVQTSNTAQWTTDYVTAHSLKFSKKAGKFTFSLEQVLKPLTLRTTPGLSFTSDGVTVSASMPLYPEKPVITDGSTAKLDIKVTRTLWNFTLNNKYTFPADGWDSYSASQGFGMNFLSGKLKFAQTSELTGKFRFKSLSLSAGYENNSVTLTFKDQGLDPDRLRVRIKQTVLPVYSWKNRVGFEGTVETDFSYDFSNKYSTSLTTGLSFNFAISDFLDVSLTVSSVNNGFYKYYDESDRFSFGLMWKDLLKSFDFFGTGRTQTSFTLNSIKLSVVHYMSAWNLYIDAKAGVQTNASGKPVWMPEVSIYVQWNEIPELKVENYYNGYRMEWEK